MGIKKKLQNKYIFIEDKVHRKFTKTTFQNIIATVFILPLTLTFYAVILALKSEFVNNKLNELLETIVYLLIILSFLDIYLILIYISVYTKNRKLFKIVKVISLIFIFLYSIYILIYKDIKNLNEFDNYFIIITSSIITYVLVKIIRNFTISIYNWIFNNDLGIRERDELIKFKLSFINSIIIGFITFIATLLGMSLTIKQLFFN
ncbi:Uncharacterised protein [Staphylococcus kloosii]|uniref:Uncharacterized protein n=1 Tax=Staphylococcus kloosii TaxID=29384 RepID=A0ABQ0XRT7_9STAP|nr:hypothetical protein C7J89_00520 [Staphylococcus kloosii]PNZ07610.1 hypothetical protein CD136_02480 [Staphylococcus kloosii]GEP82969.1 hypothetical protein SKL01_21470 [Staphylococcus kloosii]SUM50249.1 Uncharacterised protein [Staphylococcus kloosii]